MDYTLSLLIALAWPLVTLAIALIFRRDVTRALARVGRFKYHDLEVTFQQDLCQAEELARKLPPTVPAPPLSLTKADDSIIFELHPGQNQPFVRRFPASGEHVKIRQSLLDLVERSPRQAIDAAWDLVGKSLGPGRVRRLTSEETRLLSLLQTLKDRASTFDQDLPSRDEARRFVELACPLASRIEGRA